MIRRTRRVKPRAESCGIEAVRTRDAMHFIVAVSDSIAAGWFKLKGSFLVTESPTMLRCMIE